MSERDKDLDQMLQRLRGLEATPAQIRRWQAAIPADLKTPRTARTPARAPRTWRLDLAAAVIFGILIGYSMFSLVKPAPQRDVAGNFDPTATIESVYVKSE